MPGGIGGRLVEEARAREKGQIGVLDAQGGGGDLLEVGLDQDGGGMGRAGQGRVPGIGHEGDFGGAGLFNSFDTSDFQLRVPAQLRAQPACQLA